VDSRKTIKAAKFCAAVTDRNLTLLYAIPPNYTLISETVSGQFSSVNAVEIIDEIMHLTIPSMIMDSELRLNIG